MCYIIAANYYWSTTWHGCLDYNKWVWFCLVQVIHVMCGFLQQICSLLLAELLILHFPAAHHTPIMPTANQSAQSADGAIEEAILMLSLARTGATVSHDIVLDHLMTLILIEANLPGTLAEVMLVNVHSNKSTMSFT